jgi:hypothetical protein
VVRVAAARVNIAGTILFVGVALASIIGRDQRAMQVLIGVVSIGLFAVGIVAALWSYVSALERSRVEEVGVANLYLLTGDTAPRNVKVSMLSALAVQAITGLGGASIGAAGLEQGDLNALAFGVLVPMLGIGTNGWWAVRYGSFGPRLDRAARPTNRKIR